MKSKSLSHSLSVTSDINDELSQSYIDNNEGDL